MSGTSKVKLLSIKTIAIFGGKFSSIIWPYRVTWPNLHTSVKWSPFILGRCPQPQKTSNNFNNLIFLLLQGRSLPSGCRFQRWTSPYLQKSQNVQNVLNWRILKAAHPYWWPLALVCFSCVLFAWCFCKEANHMDVVLSKPKCFAISVVFSIFSFIVVGWEVQFISNGVFDLCEKRQKM